MISPTNSPGSGQRMGTILPSHVTLPPSDQIQHLETDLEDLGPTTNTVLSLASHEKPVLDR
jgi:hypothetical protein